MDEWLFRNEVESLTHFFMGDYETMPAHTIAGWDAFAGRADEGEEIAWNEYVRTAGINFHGDHKKKLPFYTELAADQQDALKHAVAQVLAVRESLVSIGSP